MSDAPNDKRQLRQPVELPPSLTSEHPDYAGRERYNLAQAATYLDISRCVLYLACTRNEIGHRIGTNRRRLFTQHDLDLYRAARRRGPDVSQANVGARAVSPARVRPHEERSLLQMPKVRRFS